VSRWVWLLVLAGVAGQAHEPITTKLTWTREISRIIYRRCISCHREGGKAPMSLLTYDEARPWAKAIKEEVLERRMPPWSAVKGFGDFRNDVSLSEVEIDWIAHWVEGGAPQGEEIYLPPAPNPGRQDFAAPRSKQLPLRDLTPLGRTATVVGIKLSSPPANGSLQITAQRPDGSMEPLLWVRNYHPQAPRAYYFREPVRLPRGARIQLIPADSREAHLLVSP